MKPKLKLMPLICVGLAASLTVGCATSGEVTALRVELKKVKAAHVAHEKSTRTALNVAIEERDELRRKVRVALARTSERVPADIVMPVPIKNAPSRGPEHAWVTIVQFSEYQCPYCARVEPTIDRILKDYEGKVKLVFRHLPLTFHKRARPAANAAECARAQGKFWEMNAKLFQSQRDLSRAAFRRYAKSIRGLKFKAWDKCFSSLKFDSRVERDTRIAADVGARGTPTFFINGVKLTGAQPYGGFKQRIEAELRTAQKSGLAVKDYYRVRVLGSKL